MLSKLRVSGLRRLLRAWPLWALPALTVAFFWKIALTNQILAGVDVFTFFYPYRAYASEAIRSGRFPLWNPHLFLGVPFFADSQSGVLYPLNVLLTWLSAPSQVSYGIVIHIVLAALFTYLFVRRSVHLSRLASFTAAAVFAFGGFLGAQAEHVNQLSISVWFPLMLYLWDRAALWESGAVKERARRAFWPLSALVGVIALALFAGHGQSLFICLVGLGLYAVWPGVERVVSHGVKGLWQRVDGRAWAGVVLGLGGAALLGFALAGVQLLPMAELSGLSLRGGGLTYREVVSFSLRPRLMLTALFPQFRTGLFSEYIAYVGIFGMALALIGFWRTANRRAARAFALFSAAGVFLALGGFNPVYYALYRLVPGFDLFRAPARWMLLYAFGMAVLAGMGLNALSGDGGECAQKKRKPILLTVGAAIVLFGIGAVWMDRPTWQAAALWPATATMAGILIWFAARDSDSLRRVAPGLLALGLVAELFFASRSLAYNHPTAPQAYTSMRTSVAHILADGDTGRVLSLSDLIFDPGDLREMQRIYGKSLPPDALYSYVVATKEKEILAPNLPMVYGISSLDGYGGGILPLRDYVNLERLFVPEEKLSPDGRLREGLTEIPDGRLLGAFGVKYVIADKAYDIWREGVYYDLSLRSVLPAGETLDVPMGLGAEFPADAIGLVSYLDGMSRVPDDTQVAELVLQLADGTEQRLPILAGRDTSEGAYGTGVAHSRAREATTLRSDPNINCYLATYSLPTWTRVESIQIVRTSVERTLVIRGMSLVNGATGTFWPLAVSTSGHFSLAHSGDVKIYENSDVKPRLYVAFGAKTVADSEEAITAMLTPDFDASTTVTVVGGQDLVAEGSPGASVQVVADEPERIAADVELDAPGYLVLSDTDYPGWTATVDGVEAPILRANGLVRAVFLTAGSHHVEFSFWPQSLVLGTACSAAAFAVWAVLAMWLGRRPSASN